MATENDRRPLYNAVASWPEWGKKQLPATKFQPVLKFAPLFLRESSILKIQNLVIKIPHLGEKFKGKIKSLSTHTSVGNLQQSVVEKLQLCHHPLHQPLFYTTLIFLTHDAAVAICAAQKYTGWVAVGNIRATTWLLGNTPCFSWRMGYSRASAVGPHSSSSIAASTAKSKHSACAAAAACMPSCPGYINPTWQNVGLGVSDVAIVVPRFQNSSGTEAERTKTWTAGIAYTRAYIGAYYTVLKTVPVLFFE